MQFTDNFVVEQLLLLFTSQINILPPAPLFMQTTLHEVAFVVVPLLLLFISLMLVPAHNFYAVV